MKFWDRLRERRAAKREEREADDDLEALERGEIGDLGSLKPKVRDEYIDEGFPSAGAGYLPPP